VAFLGIALTALAMAGPAAPTSDRTLSFFNTHTNETLTVVYKRDGRYIPEAMAQINYILRDWRRKRSRWTPADRSRLGGLSGRRPGRSISSAPRSGNQRDAARQFEWLAGLPTCTATP
jgi:hypothetical protein